MGATGLVLPWRPRTSTKCAAPMQPHCINAVHIIGLCCKPLKPDSSVNSPTGNATIEKAFFVHPHQSFFHRLCHRAGPLIISVVCRQAWVEVSMFEAMQDFSGDNQFLHENFDHSETDYPVNVHRMRL